MFSGLNNRIRRLLNIRGKKESLIAPLLGVQAPSGTVWTPKNYENYAKEAYLKNVIAFKAIDEVAKSVSIPPWQVFRSMPDGGRERVDDHAITNILKRPNPSESWPFLMLKATAYLVMSGNSFFEKVSPLTGSNKGMPHEIYVHRPDRMKILLNPDTGRITGYQYEVQGRKKKWDVDPITGQGDIVHMRTFHPTDDFWGAAATESAAREIDTSNAAVEWNKSILDNEGRPGMVFTLVGPLGEDQFDRLEKKLEARSGPSKAGKNLIIAGDKGTKAEPYGYNLKDLDFNEGEMRLARKICIGYGVPPMLLGIPGEATFANYKEARLSFWETTVSFYLNYFRGEFNNWLFPEEDDLFIDYVLDNVSALSPKRDALWERANKSDFLKINEKREMVGYENIGEEGNVILVPATSIPLSMVGVEEEKEDEEKTREMLKEQGYEAEEIDDMLGLSL